MRIFLQPRKDPAMTLDERCLLITISLKLLLTIFETKEIFKLQRLLDMNNFYIGGSSNAAYSPEHNNRAGSSSLNNNSNNNRAGDTHSEHRRTLNNSIRILENDRKLPIKQEIYIVDKKSTSAIKKSFSDLNKQTEAYKIQTESLWISLGQGNHVDPTKIQAVASRQVELSNKWKDIKVAIQEAMDQDQLKKQDRNRFCVVENPTGPRYLGEHTPFVPTKKD